MNLIQSLIIIGLLAALKSEDLTLVESGEVVVNKDTNGKFRDFRFTTSSSKNAILNAVPGYNLLASHPVVTEPSVDHTPLYCLLRKSEKNLVKALEEVLKLPVDKTCAGIYTD